MVFLKEFVIQSCNNINGNYENKQMLLVIQESNLINDLLRFEQMCPAAYSKIEREVFSFHDSALKLLVQMAMISSEPGCLMKVAERVVSKISGQYLQYCSINLVAFFPMLPLSHKEKIFEALLQNLKCYTQVFSSSKILNDIYDFLSENQIKKLTKYISIHLVRTSGIYLLFDTNNFFTVISMANTLKKSLPSISEPVKKRIFNVLLLHLDINISSHIFKYIFPTEIFSVLIDYYQSLTIENQDKVFEYLILHIKECAKSGSKLSATTYGQAKDGLFFIVKQLLPQLSKAQKSLIIDTLFLFFKKRADSAGFCISIFKALEQSISMMEEKQRSQLFKIFRLCLYRNSSSYWNTPIGE